MRFGSVCSGIEAASTAWNPLGWQAAFVSEIEPFPCAVLAQRHAATPNLGDMTKFKDWNDHAIDLLVGGTPCQSFSVAGLRKGLADPRGNLILTYLAIAARYRPRWLVWENVPGVLSSGEGRDFGTLLGGLGELGYGFAYRVLDAQYVRVESHARAVPQRRRRVFVVGHLGDWRRAAAVLFERASLCGHPAPSRHTGKGITIQLANSLRASSSPSGHGHSDGLRGDGSDNLIVQPVAHAVVCHQAKGGDPTTDNYVAHSLRAEGVASEDGTGRGTPLITCVHGTQDPCVSDHTAFALGQNNGRENTIAFSCKDHGADAGEVSPTLRSMSHDGSHANGGGQVAVVLSIKEVAPTLIAGPNSKASHGKKSGTDRETLVALAFQPRIGRNGRGQPEEICPTLNGSDAGETSNMRPCVATRTAVRRLTPMECERLQGFPDGYTNILIRGKSAADGPRYKALGNSMAVNCMRWIGSRIAAVDAL